jgi:hypothetical protein
LKPLGNRHISQAGDEGGPWSVDGTSRPPHPRPEIGRLGHEIPLELARTRYGGHFEAVMRDLHESDDLRVLDYNGERAFRLFRFAELGPALIHEAPEPGRAAA